MLDASNVKIVNVFFRSINRKTEPFSLLHCMFRGFFTSRGTATDHNHSHSIRGFGFNVKSVSETKIIIIFTDLFL